MTLHVHVHGHVSSLYSTGRSSHDVSKGLERTSLQQFFSPCAFSSPCLQRQRPRLEPSRGDVFAAILFTLVYPAHSLRRHDSVLQYGVRKRGLLVRLRRLLQFSFPSGVPKGASSQLSLPSGPRHAILNYFAYGIVVFVVRDIGVYRVALAQSRPLTGSRVKKVSTTCRLRVDHLYSGTLSGTLILVPFSCHKTGTSSTSMERLQTGSLSNVRPH